MAGKRGDSRGYQNGSPGHDSPAAPAPEAVLCGVQQGLSGILWIEFAPYGRVARDCAARLNPGHGHFHVLPMAQHRR
jgi:hypothetical protein